MVGSNTVAIRAMSAADLPGAYQLQLANYPVFLVDRLEAFASRMHTADSYCLVASHEGALAGYLLAHGWPRCAPPGVDEVLPAQHASEVLYIHDLSVSSSARGLGVGRQLVEKALAQAGSSGLRTAELIAVEGAASFWRGLGFADAPLTAALAEKLAAYGSEARWMTRRIEAA